MMKNLTMPLLTFPYLYLPQYSPTSSETLFNKTLFGNTTYSISLPTEVLEYFLSSHATNTHWTYLEPFYVLETQQ